MFRKFPFYLQLDAMDCGATCLKMITKYYGKNLSIDKLRERCYTNREGVSVLGISDAAESIGMHTFTARLSYKNFKKESPLPCIVYWKEKHFLIVYKIKKNKVYVADPAHGLTTFSEEDFQKGWINTQGNEYLEGFALFLEPTPAFYEETEENSRRKIILGLKYYLSYLRPYKKYYFQLFLGLVISTVIQVIFPFLTQSLVDIGVQNQDVGFIYMILIAQIVLFLSSMLGGFISGWLSLHMVTRVRLSILSDFLIKLMKLPISYFDKKTPGDIIKRLDDHERIQSLFTSASLQFIFTIANIIVFGSILAFYNGFMFFVYALGSILYFSWILLFMKIRKELDYKSFSIAVLSQNNTFQLVTGMQEIKLQNCEKQKRWEWERIQSKIFKLSIKGMTAGQIESTGGAIINEIKNIFLTFYAANLVIEGQITIGMMLAVQYIIGQLNGITHGIIGFVHTTQNAKISVERLSEIHSMKNEENTDLSNQSFIQDERDIIFDNVSFQYGSLRSPFVLKDLSFIIPRGKITAIVGPSGSGKTTILKLILKSYEPTKGNILFGELNLKNINFRVWRNKFACVTQESFIFADTIARNIAIGEEIINKDRLKYAAISANIREFVERLPIEYNTKIGLEGVGISQGQKQRILLARAIYKDSEILLLDEATNSLDANNEKIILNNLQEYVKGKTLVVVAHRLSTVRNADQIIVLDEGQIVEIGNHEELTKKRGAYFNLIKNQLELGN